MNVDKDKIAKLIKEARLKKQDTMEEFAKRISVASNGKANPGKSNVSKWERGLHIPNDVTLQAIAQIEDKTLDEFLYGEKGIIIKQAMKDAVLEFLDNGSVERKSEYENNRDRYDSLLENLEQKFNDVVIYSSENFYFDVRKETLKNLELEYIKGARNNESSKQYIHWQLEKAHVEISKYQHDPISKKAIEEGLMDTEQFVTAIDGLIELKNKISAFERDDEGKSYLPSFFYEED